MPAVTIEQNLESRQTYLRLRGVGRLLAKPRYSIGGDSNEMLGPEGWKNQVIVNEARQCLDSGDLLLEIDPRLINYIEPGRAIEIQIEELRFAERIPSPPLMAFPSSRAPLPPGIKVYRFEKSAGGGPVQPPPLPPDDDEPTQSPERGAGGQRGSGFKPDQDEITKLLTDPDESQDDDRDASHGGDDEAGFTKVVHESDDEHRRRDDDDERRVTGDDHTREARGGDDERGSTGPTIVPTSEDDTETGKDEPEPLPQRNWKVLAGAILVGLILGFSAKYIADEYSPWSNPSAVGPVKRKIELVQTDAFGPLSEDLRQLPDKSPLGLGPDDLPQMTALTVNRGRSFFNYGAQKAIENKRAEATYWYKRSVRMIEPDALTFLGDGYLNGDGVPRDVRTGYQLLRLAAALGSEKARSYLVDRLEAGSIPNAPTTMGQAFRPR